MKKVDEQRWDRGRKKRRGRELCVLRSAHAFRDPGLNLSTFFSTYSHPQECRVGCCFCHTDSTVRILRYVARSELSTLTRRGSAHPRERLPQNEIGNIENEIAGLRSDDRSDRAHLGVLSDRHRHVGDERDCTLGKKCAFVVWIIVINRGRFPKAPGKIVKIGRVIL